MRYFTTTLLLLCLIASHLAAGLTLRETSRTIQENKHATFGPTDSPVPSPSPSVSPTKWPTISQVPSATPSSSQEPTSTPSETPSIAKSNNPTESPVPSPSPSIAPSPSPSIAPSPSPSRVPSIAPSPSPSRVPSIAPSPSPSRVPSIAPSPSPSRVPSFSPTTDTIVMWDLLTVTLADFGEPMDEDLAFLFAFLAKKFIRKNPPPDAKATVEPLIVDITEQVLSEDSDMTVTFNVTSIVAPRPLPPDFNYTYHIGYGFEHNLMDFLAQLWFLQDEQQGGEQQGGIGTVSLIEEPVEDLDGSEKKWRAVAIVSLTLAILVFLLLVLLLCCRISRKKEAARQEEDEDNDLATLLHDKLEGSTSIDKMAEESYAVPMVSMQQERKNPIANVHKCKSAACPTCAANKWSIKTTDFLSVSPSWGGLKYTFSSATSKKSKPPSTRHKKESTEHNKQDQLAEEHDF